MHHRLDDPNAQHVEHLLTKHSASVVGKPRRNELHDHRDDDHRNVRTDDRWGRAGAHGIEALSNDPRGHDSRNRHDDLNCNDEHKLALIQLEAVSYTRGHRAVCCER